MSLGAAKAKFVFTNKRDAAICMEYQLINSQSLTDDRMKAFWPNDTHSKALQDFSKADAALWRRNRAKALANFEDAIEYLDGGVESGFNHVEATVDKPMLFRVKGTRKKMILTQMLMSKNSLNDGDSFILFGGKANVWCWHGSKVRRGDQLQCSFDSFITTTSSLRFCLFAGETS